MNSDFVAEILRATDSLRAGDPDAATRIIRSALGAGGLAPTAALLPDRARRLRRPLGETVRTLDAGRLAALSAGGAAVATPEPVLPPGARFENRVHASAAGSRRYRLYVPATAVEGVEGLVVMLHGCTQSPEDFAAGTAIGAHAEARRLIVAFPAQAAGDNPMSCWNWFRPEDQGRDRGEPAIIADLTRAIAEEFRTPPDRLFVAGLSAGGAMAAVMAEAYPELYAAAGIHSGLACGTANDVLSALTAMRTAAALTAAAPPPPRTPHRTPRLIVFHGTADATVHPSHAERIVARRGHRQGETVRSERLAPGGARPVTRTVAARPDGTHGLELWRIEGAPHAWSGGDRAGSYTDPAGPDASAAMVRFFLDGAA